MKLHTFFFCLILTAFAAAGHAPDKIKIGFLVKQPEESWFQLEWKFADQAARDFGFTLIKIGATDGDKVLAGIDTLAALGAKGFVICTPDPKLGPAIKQKADSLGMKYIAVDDQWVDARGRAMKEVRYIGISGYNIGKDVGNTIFQEYRRRGWSSDDTAAIAISYNELQTAIDRINGTIYSLTHHGFPSARIVDAPQKTTDTPGGFDAADIAITKNPDIKHWLVFALNDESVVGGVRALEGRGFTAKDVIAVGINGQAAAVNEFKKPTPTGFFGSYLLQARVHGYNTARMMFEWITRGVEPAPDTRTTGTLITRDNWKKVYMEQGLSIQ